MYLHADDFGITFEQARDILKLSDSCGGNGSLTSVSAFANSPAFPDAIALALPHARAGRLRVALHVNLVEGYPVAPADELDMLVDERGAFKLDFLGLLIKGAGPQRAKLADQIERECAAQIARFVAEFPESRSGLIVDSHQHAHAIPVVFDALSTAARAQNCRISHIRIPEERLSAYRACGRAADIGLANRAKCLILNRLSRRMRENLPRGCKAGPFCGVALSGSMDRMDLRLARAIEQASSVEDGELEVLFHPVSVSDDLCLDPENKPFAAACASPARDAEARVVREWPRQR